MKVFALVCFIGVAAAARLENTYLPPNSARTAGGNGEFLGAPSGDHSTQINGQDDGKYTIASIPQQNSQQFQSASANSQGPLSSSYGAPAHQAPQRSYEPSPVYGPANGASSRSNSADAHANTLRFDNDNDGTGNYRFEYETENKISQQEQGELKNLGDGEVTVVRGSYSYIGDDGKTYTVNYIADENGFQPTGDHIDQAISMAAADAARSASSEGYQYNQGQQQGYNSNAQQGYNSNAQQGYSGQQGNNGQQGHSAQQGNGGYQY